MKIKIRLLKPFSDAIGKNDISIDFKGGNVSQLLKVLIDIYPNLKKEIFSDSDELTEYICIFVNDKPLSALDGLDTILKEDDELVFFTPVSGG